MYYIFHDLEEKEKSQLEERMELQQSDIIFDLNNGNWSVNTSVFNERIIRKK